MALAAVVVSAQQYHKTVRGHGDAKEYLGAGSVWHTETWSERQKAIEQGEGKVL